jgi:membrane protein DedA with SNARE-associated domain
MFITDILIMSLEQLIDHSGYQEWGAVWFRFVYGCGTVMPFVLGASNVQIKRFTFFGNKKEKGGKENAVSG